MVHQIVRILFIGSCVLTSFFSHAQYAIGGGVSSMFQFGNNRPLVGANLFFEMPRNNNISFYVRASYLVPQSAKGVSNNFEAIARSTETTPFTIAVEGYEQNRFGYFILDGGTRYYLINGFDEGVSLYGGTNIAMVINTMKYGYQFSDYDQSLYSLDHYNFNEYGGRGSIFSLAIGFTGGVKYTIPKVGSIFLDINPYIMMFAIPSNNMIPTSTYKSLLFNLNIGFRKELYK